jgi:phage tail-like protein
MPSYQRRDPLLAYNFQVSLLDSKSGSDGPGAGTVAISTSGLRSIAGFSEVSGLEMTMEIENHMAGGINDRVLHFPGRVRWSNLILKRGVVARRDPLDTSDLWTWFQTYLDGRGSRRDGVIMLLNEQRLTAVAWGFRRGLPVKWTGPTLNATQSAVAIESIEIAHEGLYQIKGGGELGQALSAVAQAIF